MLDKNNTRILIKTLRFYLKIEGRDYSFISPLTFFIFNSQQMKYSTNNEIFNEEKIVGTFYNCTIKHYTALYDHVNIDGMMMMK